MISSSLIVLPFLFIPTSLIIQPQEFLYSLAFMIFKILSSTFCPLKAINNSHHDITKMRVFVELLVFCILFEIIVEEFPKNIASLC